MVNTPRPHPSLHTLHHQRLQVLRYDPHDPEQWEELLGVLEESDCFGERALYLRPTRTRVVPLLLAPSNQSLRERKERSDCGAVRG